MLLDGGILTVGLVLVVWVAFADPLLSSGSYSPLGQAISVVYLVADTALVGVVACLVLIPRRGRRRCASSPAASWPS